jgi:hypothetical protein
MSLRLDSARSLLRFARKTSKNRRSGDFYPANSKSSPDNRDFCVIGGAKIHKRDRLLVSRQHCNCGCIYGSGRIFCGPGLETPQKTGLYGAPLSLRPRLRRGCFAPLQSLARPSPSPLPSWENPRFYCCRAASRLITLNDLVREEDEKKNMNHQRTFGSSAQRNTKYLISWF